ncbi:hypothetical protein Glove_320g155 [Diversispora epigaea]|uniref:AAA-ATPase-like domain-containing protein n=1 Tax=Diversispora epigaea TaxID=1348612 RepID=A0A397HUE1_9GLOM|nr:hypothetical protein Glove_320g155 [Diversispora epigaea]
MFSFFFRFSHENIPSIELGIPNSTAHINCHKYRGSESCHVSARVVFGASVIVGDDDFQNILSSRLTFVDKSMLIKEFVESSDFVSLILRPRRFGKTTNLSMLKHFFKISHSQEENDISKKLFEKLKISAEKEIMQKFFAQNPVIHISLKDLDGETWNKMIAELRILVAEIYGEHRYLINNLYPDEQRKYQKLLEEDSTESQLKFSLKALSMYLQRHFKKKCIVLVDEYDSPMERAYNKGYFRVANDFFKDMFSSLLKSNSENVAKAMFVGILRIAKSGYLSGLNNITIYPFHQDHEDLSPLYLDKFGFTSDEVELLLSLRKNLQINNVQSWYDGYISGGSIHLYNPWSIIRLLSRGTLRAYWTDTGSTQTLEKYLWKASSSFKESVEKLLKGEYITNVKIQDDLQYSHLNENRDLAIWTLLYYAGYLTINSENHLFIPNDEVRSEWHRWVVNVPFFTKGVTIESMLDRLLDGDLDSFKKEFEQVIADTLSFYDVGGSQSGENAEFVYNAFCLGMFVNARNRGFTVLSNRESGYGRYDIAIFPESGGYEIAIIIEFKVVKKNNNLVDVARKGLDKIEEKQYRAGLHKNTKKLLELGIAFEGKKACVLGHLLNRTDEEKIFQQQHQHSLNFQKREPLLSEANTLSFYDVGGSQSGENAEFVYNAFCLGMFVNARNRGFTVLSNRESGYGRYDIAIFPESGGYEIAIIIEFKVVKKNNNLVDVARKGLDKIEEKQYRAGLHKNTKKLLELGIAFEGKKACVLGHLLNRTDEGTWISD